MICLSVIESNPERRKIIREWIVSYTVKQNCELEILWIVEDDPTAKIEKYASKMQIAMIDLDSELGADCGRVLYGKNPDCRILYYRSELCALELLLSSRPISFFLWKKGKDSFLETFDEVYKEVLFALTTFRFETKSRMYLLAKRNILYFQSDLRYVDIHMIYGENPRILAKLTEVEPRAGDAFVRIHKSFLVNTKYILWLDKKKHMVLLSNGEQLPVSDAQYEGVCKKLHTL